MENLQNSIRETCRRFGVVILYAFGSRAQEVDAFFKGEARLDPDSPSDVDMGAKLRPSVDLSIREKVLLTMELEDIIESGRVDLCFLEQVNPFVAANIIRGERIYCENPRLADEYELYILRRAGDLAFLERERQDLVFGKT